MAPQVTLEMVTPTPTINNPKLNIGGVGRREPKQKGPKSSGWHKISKIRPINIKVQVTVSD